MLFKLSMRNIRRSLKDYVIYFFTLVLGVAIFYVFNSLESQTVMLNVSANTHELIGLMNGVMSTLSVLVAIVLGFLILYASRFLMKRRKKEFGVYMTLGMSKGQISRILLVETLVIGLVALGVGLLVGIVASQFLSILVANLFEADMTNFAFVFSGSALLATVGLFSVIYLVVMIFNTISVGRQQLIKLIHSDKMNEKVKMRNTALCMVLFVLAVALLGRAYYGVTQEFANLTETTIVLYIAMGILGTFLLFWSLSGLALKVAMKFKGLYYRGLNSFVFREVNSKINTTVISMSIISLLLFLTIGIFSTAMSLKNSMTEGLKTLVPADFQAAKYMSSADEANGTMTAEEVMRAENVDVDKYFDEKVQLMVYSTEDLTYADTVGAEAFGPVEGLTEETKERMLESREDIVLEDDYNRLAEIYHLEHIDLEADEYAVVGNYEMMVEVRNRALGASTRQIEVAGSELKPKYNHVVDGFLDMAANPSSAGFVVVPSDLNLSGHESYSVFVGNYNTEEMTVDEVDEYLAGVLDAGNTMNKYAFLMNSRIEVYNNSVGLSALVTFIGLYLGSIFLITSAALLGLKEISEASDNRKKYMTLRDLGVSQTSLRRTLLVQIGIFFGLPLIVAIIHSIFGIAFANQILTTFARVDLLGSILMTAGFVLLIYGGYFLITYITSRRIVLTKE